ncbi:hypothetical protein GPECTOR_54g190 [Gonium pectorale]|uniref:U3 small nucleolar RNA-associated protein 25 n=1 Tax=Gonium pectorale TaxID=33097 RepID=A0A150G6E9_GONPE|nr:hypothetical protein GPECTOR_54g190 [Gonium pectorale]|eukprot:KXZ45449.1 hypothetical protein GPECTOR_54g190 [Gonium pectorale]
MDELSRARRGGGGGGGLAAAGRGGASLRAQLQRLRQEQLGASSDEDEDEGEEDDGEESSGSDDGGSLGGADGVDGLNGVEDEEEGGKGARGRAAGRTGAAAGVAANGLAKAKNRGGGSGSGEGDDDASGSDSEAESEGDADEDAHDEGEEGEDNDSEEGADAAGRDGGAESRSAGGVGPPTAAPLPDSWAAHVGRELSDMEAAALEGGRFEYRDAPPAEVHSTAWGADARWQLRMYGAASAAGGRRRRKADAGVDSGGSGGGGAAAAANGADESSVVALTALPPAPPTLPEYCVKERLVTRWREVHQEEAATAAEATAGASEAGAGPPASSSAASAPAAAQRPPQRPDCDFVSPAQRSLFSLLNSYADVHLPARPYPTSVDKEGPGGTPRDQGFTRPKVLLLLPQRNFAFRAVRRLVALAIRETRSDSVQGKERFVEQFTDPEDAQDEEALDAATRARLASKPAEHRAMFAGNLDDHFRLGIKVTKGAIRLFADLYQSDIIVASPLALATKLAEDKAADPHSAPDFLSSIEVLVLDRIDVMTMQNWAHVETVVAALNRLPRQQHGVDIMRVRDWYLAGRAGLYRQTVLLSSFAGPDANALARGAANAAGAARLALSPRGVLGAVVPAVRQLFERFPAASPAAAADARFEFFSRAIWPRLKDSVTRGMLLFVPTYFDFLRIRNALKQDDSLEFAAISEYSSNAEVTRARARFFHGQRRLLLYTERAHFYHRYRIRGIKDILFYGLPEHGHYYSELVNLLEEGGGAAGGAGSGGSSLPHATVTALFCPWDVLALERVVGSSRARSMLRGESGTYMFC